VTGPRALLIGCGEADIRDALEAFESSALAGRPVERVFVPGGCWWLALAAEASSSRVKRAVLNRSSAMDAVTATLRGQRFASVALTGHQDCEWYLERFPRLGSGELVKRVGTDLYAGRDELLRLAGRPLPVTGTVLVRATGGWEPRALF